MDVDYEDNEPQSNSKVNDFSIFNSESPDVKSSKNEIKVANPIMPPSERLKKLENAKAELLEANAYKIIVKITPPAQEISIESNTIRLSNPSKKLKRRYTYKFHCNIQSFYLEPK